MTDSVAQRSAQGVDDRSLLIVDDDAPFRNRLARAMEGRGFRCSTAGSVAEGVDAARAHPPCFAVLDLRLDDGSGLEVVKALREARAETRIVKFPAYADSVAPFAVS